MQSTSHYTPQVILITGGCGFIASHVLEALYDRYPNYRFVNLDLLTYSGRQDNIRQDIRDDVKRYVFVHGDVCNAQLILRVLREHCIDTIMHFAAESHVDRSFANSLVFTHANVVGTHTLLECVREVNAPDPRAVDHFQSVELVKCFVHVSTDEVYGHAHYQDSTYQLDERSLLLPTNPYSASKAAAEMYIQAYQKSHRLPCIIARPNNVYGPRQFPEKLIPKMLLLAHRGKPLTVHGNGTQRRSFVHVADMASAFDLLLHRGKLGEIYNIGHDQEITVLDVVQRIARLTAAAGLDKKPETSDTPDTLVPAQWKRQRDEILHVRDRTFNDQRYFVNSQKMHDLGWWPQMDFDLGLLELRDWYQRHVDRWSSEELDNALLPHPVLHITGQAGGQL